MKISQLKTISALIKNNFNITQTAEDIHLAQSAVSRKIQLLESELGSPLFIRNGKRLIGPTPLCKHILKEIQAIELAESNIQNIAVNINKLNQGVLRIATTHTQARFFLPPVIMSFRKEYPKVELVIEQGVPTKLVNMLRENIVDLAICTEAIGEPADLSSIQCYKWQHILITLPGHPLSRLNRQIELKDLYQYDIITYSHQFAGGSQLRETFAKANLTPHIVLAAADTDVIKTYVKLGLGVGIVANMSITSESGPDQSLYSAPLGHLFGESTTRVAWKNNNILTLFAERCKELMLKEGKRIQQKT